MPSLYRRDFQSLHAITTPWRIGYDADALRHYLQSTVGELHALYQAVAKLVERQNIPGVPCGARLYTSDLYPGAPS